MTDDDHPTLADLATNPVLAAEIDLDDIPQLLGEMERLRAILWARLALRINRPPPTEDRLLNSADAASRLGISKDWLYRNASRLPFTVRVSEGLLRFSATGIDRFIASRLTGRRL